MTELQAVGREMGEVLWRGLCRDLRATRLQLDHLLDALRNDPARVLRSEHALATQDELDERTRRAGWCLGVLAAARGIDLLHARREDDGLRWLVAAVAEARSLALLPRAEELPVLSGGASAWEVALLGSWCALQAGRPAEGVLRWSASDRNGIRRLVFELDQSPAGLATRCARLNPAGRGSPRLELAHDRLELTWS